MRIGNDDRLPLGIYGGNTAPTPTGFTEIVSDDPVLFDDDIGVFVFLSLDATAMLR